MLRASGGGMQTRSNPLVEFGWPGLRLLWIITSGILIPLNWRWLGNVRIALSDLVLFAAFYLLLVGRHRGVIWRSLKGLPFAVWIAALAFAITGIGSLVTLLRQGY